MAVSGLTVYQSCSKLSLKYTSCLATSGLIDLTVKNKPTNSILYVNNAEHEQEVEMYCDLYVIPRDITSS